MLLQNIKFTKVVKHKSWLKIIADAYENDNINDEWEKESEDRPHLFQAKIQKRPSQAPNISDIHV